MAVTLAELCGVAPVGEIVVRGSKVRAVPVTAAQRRSILAIWPRPVPPGEIHKDSRGQPVQVPLTLHPAHQAALGEWAERLEVMELAIAIDYRVTAAGGGGGSFGYDAGADAGARRIWLEQAYLELSQTFGDAELARMARDLSGVALAGSTEALRGN